MTDNLLHVQPGDILILVPFGREEETRIALIVQRSTSPSTDRPYVQVVTTNMDAPSSAASPAAWWADLEALPTWATVTHLPRPDAERQT